MPTEEKVEIKFIKRFPFSRAGINHQGHILRKIYFLLEGI